MDYSFDYSFLDRLRDDELPVFVTRRPRRIQEDNVPRSPEFVGMSTPLTPLYGPYRAVSNYTNAEVMPPFPDRDVSSLSFLSPNLPSPPSFVTVLRSPERISPPRIPWVLSPLRLPDPVSPVGMVPERSPERVSPPRIP